MGLVNELTSDEAKRLRFFLKQLTVKHTFVCVLTLCLLAEGGSVATVIQNFAVNRREVYRWLH